jgi:hypothetical protein
MAMERQIGSVRVAEAGKGSAAENVETQTPLGIWTIEAPLSPARAAGLLVGQA